MKEFGPEVICAGIIVVDHVCSPIDHLPASGELVLTAGCDLFIGGCAANVGIDLTRLGIATRVVGGVGRDVLGIFAQRKLMEAGIDTSQLVFLDEVPTSQTLVVNVACEDRRFIHLKGANDRLTALQIRETLSARTKVLYLGGLFLMDGLLAGEVADLFRAARAFGARTVLDVVTPDCRDYGPALKEILPLTDYFLPNQDEAWLMTGERDRVEQARTLQAWGAGGVAITSGCGGSFFRSIEESFSVDAFPVDALDGTGGGDAFSAGFISGLLEGQDPVECVVRGTALGASCVRARGATQGVFDRAELERFLGHHCARVVRN